MMRRLGSALLIPRKPGHVRFVQLSEFDSLCLLCTLFNRAVWSGCGAKTILNLADVAFQNTLDSDEAYFDRGKLIS